MALRECCQAAPLCGAVRTVLQRQTPSLMEVRAPMTLLLLLLLLP